MKACKICIGKFGLRGSEINNKTKTFETDEELFEHFENVYGIPVQREGETKDQAQERCVKKGISPDRSECQCEECKILRGEESYIQQIT